MKRISESNQGLILVTMLLATFLVSLLVTHLTRDFHLSVTGARNVLELEQAREYALGAEAFARQILSRDRALEQSGLAVDSFQDLWAQELDFPIAEGEVRIRIQDLQGLFNLNSLADEKSFAQFRNLLSAFSLDIGLADRARDWLDADQDSSGFGAEDGVYLTLAPPFRSANQPFSSVTEMDLLSDQSPGEDGRRLQALLAALPYQGRLRVNINTVVPAVLQALAPGVTLSRAEPAATRQEPFKTVAEAIQAHPALSAIADQLQVNSEYFVALIECAYRSQRFRLRALLHRNPNTRKVLTLHRVFAFPRAAASAEGGEAQREAPGT